jgi:hypothetical protein
MCLVVEDAIKNCKTVCHAYMNIHRYASVVNAFGSMP